jgi:hypothetical protein
MSAIPLLGPVPNQLPNIPDNALASRQDASLYPPIFSSFKQNDTLLINGGI